MGDRGVSYFCVVGLVVLGVGLWAGERNDIRPRAREAGIAPCTYRRWQNQGQVIEAQRPTARLPEPDHRHGEQCHGDRDEGRCVGPGQPSQEESQTQEEDRCQSELLRLCNTP